MVTKYLVIITKRSSQCRVERFPRLSVVSVSQSHEKNMEEIVGKVV